MSEVECPCCNGAGKISIVPHKRRPRGWLTIPQLAKKIGRTKEMVWGHMRAGVLHVVTGEWKGSRTVRYLVPPAEVRKYIEYVNERVRPCAASKDGYDALIDSELDAELVAEQLGLKTASVKRARQRRAK